MYASCGDETANNVNNVYEAVGIGGVGVGDGGGVGGGVGSFGGGGGSVVMVNGVAVDTQENEENLYDTCDSTAGNPYAAGGPMADRGGYYEDISGGPMVDRGAYEDIPC